MENGHNFYQNGWKVDHFWIQDDFCLILHFEYTLAKNARMGFTEGGAD